MKKFLVTILAVFYLGVSSGATVHFHYCMGQLVEWGLSSTESKDSSGCSKCGMDAGSENDCCKHQSKEAKVDKVQKAAENHFYFAVPATELRSGSAFYNIPSYSLVMEAYPLSNSPPAISSTATYLRVCSFRI
ncbi:HYC_CC_PP family protein [Arcticibacter sp.]|jgi:hypothetical protein|uniref:HYC_CC_PP family protein n=1 Tax=Arcticibacter sp. TaxID=1872630 RepID=UPI00388D600E